MRVQRDTLRLVRGPVWQGIRPGNLAPLHLALSQRSVELWVARLAGLEGLSRV